MIAFAFKADREFCVMVVVGFVLFFWCRVGIIRSFPFTGLKNRDYPGERSRNKTITYARALR